MIRFARNLKSTLSPYGAGRLPLYTTNNLFGSQILSYSTKDGDDDENSNNTNNNKGEEQNKKPEEDTKLEDEPSNEKEGNGSSNSRFKKRKGNKRSEDSSSDLDKDNSSIVTDSTNIFGQSKALVRPSVPENYPEVLLLPISRRPLFPVGVNQVNLTDPKVISAINLLMKVGQGYLGVFMTKDDNNEADTIKDLDEVYRVGTFNSIMRVDSAGSGTSYLLSSHRRIRIEKILKRDPYLSVRVQNLKDEPYKKDSVIIQALMQEIMTTLRDIMRLSPIFRDHVAYAQMSFSTKDKNIIDDPGMMADFIANISTAPSIEKQEILESLVIEERLRKSLVLLKRELMSAKIQSDIAKDVEKKISSKQREYFLHEQLKSIKKELGIEKDDKDALIGKFKQAMEKKTLPPDAKKVFDEELAKLSMLESSSSEFNVTRSYLEWITKMPWGVTRTENLDVVQAEKILNQDHYGLEDVKQRILEFIAVGNLKGTVQGKILCLVGPPGVGKTSIGKSIAHTLNRDFFRFSVGGLTDIAEIKGHRRTYIGAMPGKIIQCFKKINSENPLVLIDEIDKIGRGYNGDPASALLEMLDPEQNSTFVDHYLDIPVDLSKVLFVCTANTLDTIPGPLLDRMEVIRLSGYTEEEKVNISQKYLIPQSLNNNAIKDKNVTIEETAIRHLIHGYCREAGVRNLQKHIDKIFRKVTLKLVQNKDTKEFTITKDNIKEYVGNPIFTSDRTYTTNPVGIVTGLAWTSMGGSTLYIESVVDRTSDKPGLFRTGQLGDVMNESSSIAYTYAKNFVKQLDPSNPFFEKSAIHMHVPDGATKKDGPSAGITITTSLVSLALNRSTKQNAAMTGEITLTGKVLRIGGVKEKTIAAKRSGITTLILPEGNQADWEELEKHIKEGLEVYFVDTYEKVFNIMFEQNNEKDKS